MPGKEMKMIGKTLHADGYYTASIISTSHEASDEEEEAAAATTPKSLPHIKLWFRFDKGIFIGPEQREKLIREQEEQEQEQAAAAIANYKQEIPTPGFVLLVKEEVEEAKPTTTTPTTPTVSSTTHSHAADLLITSSSDDYTSSSMFQLKLDATKRKMHDSYQQLTNAKKQKRIQVIDPRDLPPPTTTRSLSKGKGAVNVTARKKMMITPNRKTIRSNNNNFFDGRGGGHGRPKLMKPASIF